MLIARLWLHIIEHTHPQTTSHFSCVWQSPSCVRHTTLIRPWFPFLYVNWTHLSIASYSSPIDIIILFFKHRIAHTRSATLYVLFIEQAICTQHIIRPMGRARWTVVVTFIVFQLYKYAREQPEQNKSNARWALMPRQRWVMLVWCQEAGRLGEPEFIQQPISARCVVVIYATGCAWFVWYSRFGNLLDYSGGTFKCILSYILHFYCRSILNLLKKGYTSFIFKEIFTLCLNCHFACCAFDEHQLIAHTHFAADAQIFGLTKYMAWTLSKSFRIINWLCERAPNGYAINKGNYSILFAWITTMLYVAATHICRKGAGKVCALIYIYIYI